MNNTLVGSWVQDESGPVTTYGRRYQFNADGSYAFVLTSRQTGSIDQRTLAQEEGTFTVDGDRLVISPPIGSPKVVRWSIETDKYIGNTQLVMELPNGNRDIYYPEASNIGSGY
jgi:hypothetical protein